jgi:hypothetical protein
MHGVVNHANRAKPAGVGEINFPSPRITRTKPRGVVEFSILTRDNN